MSLNRSVIVLIIALAAACSDDAEAPVPTPVEIVVSPGVYSGVFPCEGCEGIGITLWLRADHRFFFKQQFSADGVRDAMTTYSFGRWEFLIEEAAIELRGEGPRRTFESMDGETLLMRTHSELEHRLARQPAMKDFTDTVRLTGIMQAQGDAMSFTECLTGYVAPVSKQGDFRRFQHQYRSATGQGKPVFAEFEGRYSWSADHALQAITIERFVTIKVNGSC